MFDKLLVAIFSLIILSSCTNVSDEKAVVFINSEIESSKKNIDDILQAFRIQEYDIFCIPHFRYGINEKSKQISSEKYFNENGRVIEPYGAEGPAEEPVQEGDAYYDRTQISVNYVDEEHKEIQHSYIAYLILLDKKYENQKIKIENALSKTVLNRERADILTILIK